MTKEQLLAQDFQHIFAAEDGKRVLKNLSAFCMERRSTYTAGDAYHTAFNEGARTVILEIRRYLEMNLGEVPQTQTINQEII